MCLLKLSLKSILFLDFAEMGWGFEYKTINCKGVYETRSL